jgi:nucleotide-binding universal stress UspA family protein
VRRSTGMMNAVRIGMNPMNRIREILVPIDFGPASEAAVRYAAELASTCDATVTLLHVYEAPVFAYSGAPLMPMEDITAAFETGAREAVEKKVGEVAKDMPRVKGLIRQGTAWRGINDVAKENAADLIVMGTHGREGLSRVLIGSVAEKVVRTSPVPVLTIHAPD